ncbi:MAG: hypothetical protein COV98_04075, partial [Candidatus Altarchaeum sp. CG12_big_fil_rev_8_21_14_0_65_33_22]
FKKQKDFYKKSCILLQLVEPKNPDELAKKILLALNKEWDEEYILNYVKKFSSDEIAKETLKVYERVLR